MKLATEFSACRIANFMINIRKRFAGRTYVRTRPMLCELPRYPRPPIIVSAPMVALCLFFQRHLIQGIVSGAVKG
jgi:ABC-type maltose transport system permease subunit